MSWRGHGGALYLGVKTLTNLPWSLRSVERSEWARVCQRCNYRVDWSMPATVTQILQSDHSVVLIFDHFIVTAWREHFQSTFKLISYVVVIIQMCSFLVLLRTPTENISNNKQNTKRLIIIIDLVKYYCTGCTPSLSSLLVLPTIIPVDLLAANTLKVG